MLLPSWAPYNNAKDCSAPVLKTMRGIERKWGKYEFTCYQGVVIEIFASTSSRVASEPNKFIRQYSGIFGAKPDVELTIDNRQSYHGIPLASPAGTGLFFQEIGSESNGGRFKLSGHLVDTTSWKFDPIKVSSESAKTLADKSWRDRQFVVDTFEVKGPFVIDAAHVPFMGWPGPSKGL